MKLFASLDRRDRQLLGLTAVLTLCSTVLLVMVRPQEQADSGIPSSYSTAPHGAKAAYLLLARLGYSVERSDAPLASVASAANAHTVLILAEPIRATSQQESAAIRRVLENGGRILAAGPLAATALPDNQLETKSPPQLFAGICEAEPLGFSSLAGGGKVVMREVRLGWKPDLPGQQSVYTCANETVVVTYTVDKGSVVWWASATPLENQDIAAGGSVALLLNSLQLAPGDRIVWDESLHAQPVAAWDPAKDRIILALLAQLLLVGLLLMLARGRRSGPLRPLPAPARGSPMEFVRSLGGLYRASGANDVPVTIAYERFRALLAQRFGITVAPGADAATLAATLTQRLGLTAPSLAGDLAACEGAGRLIPLSRRQALALVQALAHYTELVTQRATSHSETNRGILGSQSQYGPRHIRRSA